MNSTNGSKLPYPLRGATRITINTHKFSTNYFFSVPIFSNIRIIRDENYRLIRDNSWKFM